jgi:guanylate kinase
MNQLIRLEDFKKALNNYRVSNDARELLAQLKLVLLVGPSSSGRNTIINQLVEYDHYHQIVSDTTRQPRSNNGVMEENGREYWFRAESDILHDIESGEFLEAAIIHEQQVSGISMRELRSAAHGGKIAINEIEVAGADNIHEAKPDALFIFVLPPSFNEWMARMQNRGNLPEDEIQRRLKSAVDELTIALDRDYYTFVVNDTFIDTAARIDALATGRETQTPEQQAAGKDLAKQLLASTTDHLA